MALADLSFKLYTDSGLTTLFSGLYQLTHQSNLSDNPQDFQLWFGSNAATTLETTTNPGVDNITLTPVEILPAWTASTAYTVGETVEPTVDNGFRYACSTAGTSDTTEPASWPTSGIGSTVVDGTVIWTLVAATHEPTEIKLSATAAGLDSATAGAALSLGTSISAGVANAKEVNIRITNAVTTVSNNTAYPELSIDINDVTES
jgi:hypothetical protein